MTFEPGGLQGLSSDSCFSCGRTALISCRIGYTWDGSAGSCLAPWDEASGVPQGGVYARVGDVLAVIEALGVDAEQHFDAVPRSVGHSGWGTPAAS
jgi:hypothetical protein